MEDVLKTAVGVFIGALAAIFAWEGIHLVALEVAAKEAAKQMQATTQKANQQIRAQAEARAAQVQANAEAQAVAEQAARVQQAEIQRQGFAHETNQIALKNARDEAWRRYYQPSEACRANWTGNCADAFIQAKRAFEERYGKGQ